ncbi:MAG: hypothetical protein ACOC97_02330 [Myxococcota bacterium]
MEDRTSSSGSLMSSPARGVWPESATVQAVHRAYCVATWGPMLVLVWNGGVRGDRLGPVIAAARDNCRRHPEGGGFMLIVGPDTGLPDAAARAEASRALTELGGYIHSTAIVIEGEGFRVATARSALSTMFFAAGKRVTMRVFKSLADATTWQAAAVHCDPPFSPDQYLKVVEEVRRTQAAHRESTPPIEY